MPPHTDSDCRPSDRTSPAAAADRLWPARLATLFGLPLLLPLIASVWFLAAPENQAAPPSADAGNCVILVSLDGFANFYLDDPQADLPTMRRMIREGAVAERGLECSFPTVTWPNHTTMVTGVPPAEHGVLGNSVYDREADQKVMLLVDPVFDKEEIVRAQTIYDAAHTAGLKTAGIVWPATRNAATLDWCIPDMGPQEMVEKYSTPGWLDELQKQGIPYDLYGGWVKAREGGPRRDWIATRAAASLFTYHQPNLILLHLIELDHAEHEFGPRSGDAYWAVKTMDDRLRDLLDAIHAAGLEEKTTLLVASDHGFFAIDHEIRVNVKMRQMGLVKLEADKVVQRDAWSLSQGGGAAVYILNDERRAEIARELANALGQLEGVEELILPKDFERIGQATREQHKFGADLWLAAKEGYSFSESNAGDQVVIAIKRAGTHGYLPHHPDMQGILIAWGRGVRPGAKLGAAKNTQIAPTIARLLGLELPGAKHGPVQGLLADSVR